MSESALQDLSMDFAVEIVELNKSLKAKHETAVSSQIVRSGTSIGANIHEAHYAQSKKDFISKLEIALKEANETTYWLELLYRTRYVDYETYQRLKQLCSTIRMKLITSVKTAKSSDTTN